MPKIKDIVIEISPPKTYKGFFDKETGYICVHKQIFDNLNIGLQMCEDEIEKLKDKLGEKDTRSEFKKWCEREIKGSGFFS